MKNNIKRVLALLFGVFLLLCVEVLLRFSGYAPLSREEWSAAHGVYSIERYFAQAPQHFEENEEGQCSSAAILSQGSDSTRQGMQPQQFPCTPSGKRIITLGGSSIQGYGLPAGMSLASQLQTQLDGLEWDVINAGVAGYNSLQIRRMMPEIWKLEPSIIILYAGHNDFVFYPMIEDVLATSNAKIQLRSWGDRLALWRFLRERLGLQQPPSGNVETPSFEEQAKAAFNQLPLPRPKTATELKNTHQEQQTALENIRSFYRENISFILEEATQRDVEVLLIVPVSRLDSPPVDGIHWKTLSDNQLQQWEELWAGLQQDSASWEDPRWQTLLSLDDSYAPATHAAAQQAWFAGQKEVARTLWNQAQEMSPPSRSIRMPASFGDWIVATGTEAEVPVLDLRPIWKEAAEEKDIPAGDLFLDAVHFNERSIMLLSELCRQQLQQHGWL